MSTPQVKSFLRDLRSELTKVAKANHFEWKDNLVSDVKLLDSALWALYSVQKNPNNEKGQKN